MRNYGIRVSQKGYDVKDCPDNKLVFSSSFQTLKTFLVTSATDKIPSGNYDDFTVNVSTDELISSGHGLSVGDPVNFTTTDKLPTPLKTYDEGMIYFVVYTTANTFKVSETKGGTPVDITDHGSGTHTWWNDETKLVIQHNLGYYAPYVVVYNGSSRTGLGSSYFFSDSTGTPMGTQWTNYKDHVEIHVNDGFDDPNSQPGDTIYFTIYVYLDDFSTINENNIITSGSSGGYGNDYGFRVSKDGYDVKTCEDKDLVVSSSTPTHIVHKKGMTTSSDVYHNLGYVPAFLAYAEDNNNIYVVDSTISTTKLTMGYGSSSNYYYIIFKNRNY